MRFQKLMISTVISLWMDADRTIGRWGAFEVNINSFVTYRESCCHISLMLIDFLQLCSNIMELDCNGAQLQTKVLPSFRVCSVWDLQPPPLLSNYTWPYLESFHCYNELWFENVTINHNLRISFYFLSRWDEWCRKGIQNDDVFNEDTRKEMKDHVASRANNIFMDIREVIYLYGENHFICINAMSLSKGSPWCNGLKTIRWTF